MASYEQLNKLPKIELHAHLSGSVSNATLLKLLEEQINSNTIQEREKYLKLLEELQLFSSTRNEIDLDICFKLFAITHKILSSKRNLERITREVLDSFDSINVVYLELRTTPRNVFSETNTKEIILSKKDYIDTVLDVFKDHETKSNMIARLILSVDRSRGLEDALDTIELANMYKDYVVGIDFSGNPKVSSFKNFQPCFDLIRKYNLKMTIHTAEIWDDLDVEYILKTIRPERIGHAVCLNNEQIEYLLQNPIPIEICPTSNIVTKCVKKMDEHPFFEFYKQNQTYPLTICTDDCGRKNKKTLKIVLNFVHNIGILKSNLTEEYAKISEAFNLPFISMYHLSKNSIANIFDKSEKTLNALDKIFKEFEIKYF